MSKSALFWQGYRATMPLVVGVVPFGILFGALAVAKGLSPFESIGMSILVFAGSSQFIAINLIGEHASIWVIVLTTLLINLRNFLYSASVAPFVHSLSQGWKWLIAYPIVDEIYATVMTRYWQGQLAPEGIRWFYAGAAANLVSVWWLSTVIGAMVGDILPQRLSGILGFTLPLILTALVVPLLATRPALLAAASAALLGIVLAPMPHNLGLLIAAGAGIIAGLLAEKKQVVQKESLIQ